MADKKDNKYTSIKKRVQTYKNDGLPYGRKEEPSEDKRKTDEMNPLYHTAKNILKLKKLEEMANKGNTIEGKEYTKKHYGKDT